MGFAGEKMVRLLLGWTIPWPCALATAALATGDADAGEGHATVAGVRVVGGADGGPRSSHGGSKICGIGSIARTPSEHPNHH